MVTNGTITPLLAVKVLMQFDKVMSAVCSVVDPKKKTRSFLSASSSASSSSSLSLSSSSSLDFSSPSLQFRFVFWWTFCGLFRACPPLPLLPRLVFFFPPLAEVIRVLVLGIERWGLVDVQSMQDALQTKVKSKTHFKVGFPFSRFSFSANLSFECNVFAWLAVNLEATEKKLYW